MHKGTLKIENHLEAISQFSQENPILIALDYCENLKKIFTLSTNEARSSYTINVSTSSISFKYSLNLLELYNGLTSASDILVTYNAQKLIIFGYKGNQPFLSAIDIENDDKKVTEYPLRDLAFYKQVKMFQLPAKNTFICAGGKELTFVTFDIEKNEFS